MYNCQLSNLAIWMYHRPGMPHVELSSLLQGLNGWYQVLDQDRGRVQSCQVPTSITKYEAAISKYETTALRGQKIFSVSIFHKSLYHIVTVLAGYRLVWRSHRKCPGFQLLLAMNKLRVKFSYFFSLLLASMCTLYSFLLVLLNCVWVKQSLSSLAIHSL